ncbi:hypothetical protein BDV93DRAFT_83425 [Ceratobasidium sp. AG-I]|nr:hypothetical protein BDV93DRAFT_83425 [Ceratobasidium sp. AG-I]
MVLSGHEPYREMKTVFGVARAITGGRWPYELDDCEYNSVWGIASSCWAEGLLQRPRVGALVTRIDAIRSQMQ